MPLIETDQLIKEFYNSIKDKYPNINEKQVEDICNSSFCYIKEQIARPDMPTIQVKFLGKFKVFSSRIKNLIKTNENRVGTHRISNESLDDYRLFLQNKLDQLQKEELLEENKNKIVELIDDINTNEEADN